MTRERDGWLTGDEPEQGHVDRATEALCRFVFPGHVVPRTEMARAVCKAIAGGENWRDYLPPKHVVVRPD